MCCCIVSSDVQSPAPKSVAAKVAEDNMCDVCDVSPDREIELITTCLNDNHIDFWITDVVIQKSHIYATVKSINDKILYSYMDAMMREFCTSLAVSFRVVVQKNIFFDITCGKLTIFYGSQD